MKNYLYRSLLYGIIIMTVSTNELVAQQGANYIPRFSSPPSLVNSIIYQNSGRIGIGTTNPSRLFHVSGNLRIDNGSSLYLDFWHENGNVIYTNADLFIASGRAFVLRTGAGNDHGQIRNGANQQYVRFDGANRRVGIRTLSPAYELDVNGTVRANEVIVNTTGADFVFEESYNLLSLEEVENYIFENSRLPGIPSAGEMQERGMEVGVMQTLLLQKIEELTLHLIELKNDNNQLKNSFTELLNSIK
jgi:hypothetical protein